MAIAATALRDTFNGGGALRERYLLVSRPYLSAGCEGCRQALLGIGTGTGTGTAAEAEVVTGIVIAMGRGRRGL